MSEALSLPVNVQAKSITIEEEEDLTITDADTGLLRKKDGDQNLYWVIAGAEYSLTGNPTGDQKFDSLELTDTTNQLILGTTNKTTINSVAPSTSRTYTIPDAGTNTSFAMLAGSQTFSSLTTFTNGISTPLPFMGSNYPFQSIPWFAFRNPTNADSTYPFLEAYTATGSSIITMSVRFQGSALGVDYGTVQVKTLAATYKLYFALRLQSTHGIFIISFDGVDKGSYDAYAASTTSTGVTIDLGVLTAGVHTIGLRGVGKNASSSGYLIAFTPDMYLIQSA